MTAAQSTESTTKATTATKTRSSCCSCSRSICFVITVLGLVFLVTTNDIMFTLPSMNNLVPSIIREKDGRLFGAHVPAKKVFVHIVNPFEVALSDQSENPYAPLDMEQYFVLKSIERAKKYAKQQANVTAVTACGIFVGEFENPTNDLVDAVCDIKFELQRSTAMVYPELTKKLPFIRDLLLNAQNAARSDTTINALTQTTSEPNLYYILTDVGIGLEQNYYTKLDSELPESIVLASMNRVGVAGQKSMIKTLSDIKLLPYESPNPSCFIFREDVAKGVVDVSGEIFMGPQLWQFVLYYHAISVMGDLYYNFKGNAVFDLGRHENVDDTQKEPIVTPTELEIEYMTHYCPCELRQPITIYQYQNRLNCAAHNRAYDSFVQEQMHYELVAQEQKKKEEEEQQQQQMMQQQQQGETTTPAIDATPAIPPKVSFVHVVNPFVFPVTDINQNPYVPLDKEQHFAFLSMIRARDNAAQENIRVVVACGILPGEFENPRNQIIDDLCNVVFPIERTVASEYPQFDKKIPFLRDLFLGGDAASPLIDTIPESLQYMIFTNSDIGLAQDFYHKAASIILNPETANRLFTINRVKIENHDAIHPDSTLEDVYHLMNTQGEWHPGHDCFVFQRDLVGYAVDSACNMFLGYPPWGYTMQHRFGNKYGWGRGGYVNYQSDLNATFHLGGHGEWYEGDLFWPNDVDLAYMKESCPRPLSPMKSGYMYQNFMNCGTCKLNYNAFVEEYKKNHTDGNEGNNARRRRRLRQGN